MVLHGEGLAMEKTGREKKNRFSGWLRSFCSSMESQWLFKRDVLRVSFVLSDRTMLWCSQEELFPFQDIERRGEERKLFHERRGVGSVGWAVWVVRGSQSFSSSGLNYDIWNSLNFIHPLPDTPLLAFFNKNKKEKKKNLLHFFPQIPHHPFTPRSPTLPQLPLSLPPPVTVI